ncbi:hypothetical protein [Cellvibrio zantedeschiae]|uniref:hypothetical protein n=1 Tax=Cellvibrio zantedeschiae TaxID=1237077 RepID=UPI0016778C3C|nr:hypothetical protein [Cellvibrio zantedeschiae]
MKFTPTKFTSTLTFLIVATAMVTFSLISFTLFPRPLSLDNPTFLVETIFVGGLMLMVTSTRQLRYQSIKIKD